MGETRRWTPHPAFLLFEFRCLHIPGRLDHRVALPRTINVLHSERGSLRQRETARRLLSHTPKASHSRSLSDIAVILFLRPSFDRSEWTNSESAQRCLVSSLVCFPLGHTHQQMAEPSCHHLRQDTGAVYLAGVPGLCACKLFA